MHAVTGGRHELGGSYRNTPSISRSANTLGSKGSGSPVEILISAP